MGVRAPLAPSPAETPPGRTEFAPPHATAPGSLGAATPSEPRSLEKALGCLIPGQSSLPHERDSGACRSERAGEETTRARPW